MVAPTLVMKVVELVGAVYRARDAVQAAVLMGGVLYAHLSRKDEPAVTLPFPPR